MNTFGFEAEFASGVSALTEKLHGANLCYMERPHQWHCSCEDCDFGNSAIFRVQNDSSCDGEVISKVFDSGDWGEAVEAMATLERLAIEVDAEPGLSAGCHVHVGVDHMANADMRQAFYEVWRWENVLVHIAAGRWPTRRASNENLQDRLPARNMRAIATREERPMERVLWEFHREGDRYSNLNTRTNHGTWEFRLWNSTRAAWRMELWCRLSLLMVDLNFVTQLQETAHVTTLDFLEQVQGHCQTTAILLERQLDYLTDGAAQAPPTFTLV